MIQPHLARNGSTSESGGALFGASAAVVIAPLPLSSASGQHCAPNQDRQQQKREARSGPLPEHAVAPLQHPAQRKGGASGWADQEYARRPVIPSPQQNRQQAACQDRQERA